MDSSWTVFSKEISAFVICFDSYSFYIDNGMQDGHIKAFKKELRKKESLYLKHNAQQQTRGLVRFLTFQVLCCIMVQFYPLVKNKNR